MPNWCECSLTVKTSTRNVPQATLREDFLQEVERCVEKAHLSNPNISPSDVFDFDLLAFFHPMPEELSNHYSPSYGVQPEGESEALVCEKKRRTAMYGVDNGYDWCVKNWGTKWDVYELYFDREEKVLTFQTAWAPPETWLIHVSQRFPETTFRLAYCEAGAQFAGYITVKNGTTEEISDFTGKWFVEKTEQGWTNYEASEELSAFLKEHHLQGTGG